MKVFLLNTRRMNIDRPQVMLFAVDAAHSLENLEREIVSGFHLKTYS